MLLGKSSTHECLAGLRRMTMDTPVRQPGHDRPARVVSLGMLADQSKTQKFGVDKKRVAAALAKPFFGQY
jgi:hypothetical protein